MGEDRPSKTEFGAADSAVTERIGRRLGGNPRFESVTVQPSAAPNSIVVEYDLGYFPAAVSRAYLQIRWCETDDFSIHYFHQPPDASTPGEDADFPSDWRDVIATVLGTLDDRITAFWDTD